MVKVTHIHYGNFGKYRNVIISFHFYTNTSIQTHWHLVLDEGPFQNQIL